MPATSSKAKSRGGANGEPSTPATQASTKRDPHAKKGPTPTRREQELQNIRPLVPADRKAAKRETQARQRERQREQREGLARGDDRFLRPSDRGPQKRFLRNVIDARYSLGELLMPVVAVSLFTNFLPNGLVPIILQIVLLLLLVASLIESWLVGRSVRRRIAAVVGEGNVESGLILGTIARSIQMRFLRMPKPQVRRGEKVEFTG